MSSSEMLQLELRCNKTFNQLTTKDRLSGPGRHISTKSFLQIFKDFINILIQLFISIAPPACINFWDTQTLGYDIIFDVEKFNTFIKSQKTIDAKFG